MFNEDQKSHMRQLAATPPEQLHWCGWYRNERHAHPEPHSHDCPVDLTAADKINMRCEACSNEPWIDNGGRLVHLAGCTLDYRREFYAGFEYGGES